MGTVEDWKLHRMVTSPALSALILLSLLCVSSSLFFNSSPASTCSSDRQCSGFTRRECVGKQFILCFGQTRTYRVGGKCVPRGNKICSIGNVFFGRRNTCDYRECARCLTNQDCSGRLECSSYRCVDPPRNDDFNNPRG